MKYDCSKTLNYSHERRRMCDSFCDQKGIRLCFKCPLQGLYCTHVCRITPEHIDIVQKWSDEHPEKTRKEAYLEIFPKLEDLKDKVVNFDSECLPCFYELIGKCEGDYCGEKTCGECWNRPYNGEFEKEASE